MKTLIFTREFNPITYQYYNVDTEALIAALSTRWAVFDDSYGRGVVCMDGETFSSWFDAAAYAGLDIEDFTLD